MPKSPMSVIPSKWSYRITAGVMAAEWLLFLVLNQRWLAGSVSECGPDSAPECGKFDGIPETIYGGGTVLAIIALVVAVGVWFRKTAALVTGAVFQILVVCQLGPAISTAPISTAMQTFWGWTFGLTNFGLALFLFSLLAAPRVPENPS
ncbi:hypothetical protein [Glycomyces arizonensis]|uniref:hypothetical protein n=1 Tax=Glycomyces arizonensis TaxID=256035 RepID=UPI000417B188|nr:hypothetical protein [Glycomyces arizonensis]